MEEYKVSNNNGIVHMRDKDLDMIIDMHVLNAAKMYVSSQYWQTP